MAANTVIALKKSAVPSSVPSNLANGEIAINYADGKLYYKNVTGQIVEFTPQTVSNYFGSVNANNTLIVADTSGDVFSLVAGDNVTIVGDAINDIITISASLPGGGDPAPAFNQANTARDSANAAYAQANAAYDAANNAVTDFSPAFNQANTARTHANAAYGQANTARDSANTGINDAANANSYIGTVASAGNTYAETVAAAANSGTGAGANAYSVTVGTAGNNYTIEVGAASNNWTNTVISYPFAQANAAYDYANIIYAQANAAYNAANTEPDYVVANAAFAQANAAYNQANTATNDAANANSYIGTVAAAGNTYAQTVGTAGNNYTIKVGAASNNWANTVANYANGYSNATFVKLTSTSKQTITSDVDIVGNLTLSGNTFVVDAQTLNVTDPLIYLAGNNYSSDIVDIGFIANYVNATGQNVHTGLYREHENKEYYLFYGYDKEPINNHIGALSNNMVLAVLNADIRTSNLNLGGSNTILAIAAGNTYAATVAAAANAGTGAGANAYAQAVGAAANSGTGAGANAYAVTVGAAANGYANTIYGYANGRFLANDTTAGGYVYTGNLALSTGNVLINTTVGSSVAATIKLNMNGAGNSSGWYDRGTLVQAISNNYTLTNALVNAAVGSANAFAYTGNLFITTGNVLIGRTVSSTISGLRLDVLGGVNASAVYVNGVALSTVPKGGGTDDIFYENSKTITTNYTITTNKNAMTTGPVTINSGVTITVPSGSRWVVI